MFSSKLYNPPTDIPLNDILPEEPLLLMGAGPVPLPHQVARANSVVINHLGETMDRIIAQVKLMGQYVFQTGSDKVFGVAGPSSAAMEMAITNILWPGRKVLVLVMGTFSRRFAELAECVGAQVDILESESNCPMAITAVELKLSQKQYDVVTLVQGETSSGVFNKDLQAICSAASQHGALVVVDAVCTLTTMPFLMDEWHVDVAVTGGQKGLSSIPGVSLIAFSNRAWQAVEARTSRCPHWCLDVRRAYLFWHKQQYHYTAPVPGILALYEALRLIAREGLEKRWERHRVSSTALQTGIQAMGLELFIPVEYRLNSVVAIKINDGVDSFKLRKNMAQNYNVEISGAFGLPILRIGQMGEQCRSHNLLKTLYALGMCCRQEGMNVDVAAGMAQMEEKLAPELK